MFNLKKPTDCSRSAATWNVTSGNGCEFILLKEGQDDVLLRLVRMSYSLANWILLVFSSYM
jgi:hypothetical protein